MTPAVWPRARRSDARLLVLDGTRPARDARVGDLPDLLAPGDVLVVNDAATLPASLLGQAAAGAHGRRASPHPAPCIEARLCNWRDDEGGFSAVLFGSGGWRQRTEDRPPPPLLLPGARLSFDGGLTAVVEALSPVSPRLVELRFDRRGAALWSALFAAGRPVQYSHVCGALELWHVQTAFAGRPWALEMPSAGAALSARLLSDLRARGRAVHALTHAAGLSSTGDAELDALLPLPERYLIPTPTAEAVNAARRAGGRVIAAGTTVVRALESAAGADGRVRAGGGTAHLRLGHSTVRRVVDGLLTGLHEPGTSHHALAQAFAPRARLDAAFVQAEAAGYLGHEFGDLSLVLAA